ncbi:MAG: ATP12 family protein [Sulfitobacter sp.]
MSDWKAKRFWKEATVEEGGEGFEVRLDGRPVKTPAKRSLILPTRAMAEVIAAEWDAQEGEIKPHLMPATKTANAAVDKVAVQHAEVADMLADYGDCDLLCYRAEGPPELVERQAALWDPMLAWGHEALGVRLALRTGVMHVPQDQAALAVLREKTHGLSSFELAAFHDLVSLSGSLVLGFAAARQARDAEALWELSRLDEVWQAEQWGADAQAEEMAAIKKESFLHASAMFTLCRAA